MKIKTFFRTALCVATIGSAPAIADPFIAVDFGRADASLKNFDSHETSYEISGGYIFDDVFALSLGYTDYGKYDITKGSGEFRGDATAIDLTGTGILALSDQFGLTGKLGVDFWELDDCSIQNIPGIPDATSCDGEDAYVGIGMYVIVGDNASVQFNYELHRWDEFDMNTLSLGFSMAFGDNDEE